MKTMFLFKKYGYDIWQSGNFYYAGSFEYNEWNDSKIKYKDFSLSALFEQIKNKEEKL